ncbi:hypothetical protein CC86DRAFT_354761 [Ophiobolus disseminans]|uniref:Wings apart-like protein C-terminal domain-containing protein n=1 Tax=Ophiobolus disseminans TaxID=1469910 RepID=A0A6A6ZTG5_9PLEO|nr:hypothetical protein CC86DRAFT_354761 [Ophiobolus disseminans]
MATSMSSAFSAPERRKKVITYGKASRLAAIAPSAASSDAPSPERPRKQPAITNGLPKRTGGGLKTTGTHGTTRITTASPDIFDVPSEDEFVTRPAKPTKKLPTKHRTLEDHKNARTQNVTESGTSRQQGGLVADMRKAEASKPTALTARKSQKATQPPKAALVPISPLHDTITKTARRSKTPQPTADVKKGNENKRRTQTQAVQVKAVPRASTPEVPVSKATKSKKVNVALPNKGTAPKFSTKPSKAADIFDVPSSDDEVHMPTPKPARRAPTVPRKEPAKASKSPIANKQLELTESEDSEALKKRKRRGSVSSTVATKPVFERKQDDSLPQRSRKYPRKEDSVSPGHAQSQVPTTSTTTYAPPAVPTVNKPKRTRLRTVPVLARSTITKGQSSPASLHSMLPGSRASKPSPIAEAPETTPLEDDTMYEIPDSTTTPVRQSSNGASGSVTPRQKALFGSLLGTSSTSNTPMPSISKLQLTDRKPVSLLGALSRSKSDLTNSTQARKTKLIASLKPDEGSSGDEVSGSESETSSDGGTNERTPKATTVNRETIHTLNSRQATNIESDDMDVDDEIAADSQTSQTTSGFGIRAKLTYAKSRSYLEEANPEDALLMSMDLDAPIAFGSQTKDSQTEDEDEASQVRPNHELKRTGHNTRFQWDNQMLIDDIRTTSASGIRRSTMLELGTKMADEAYTDALLDSSLADQFLENVTSNGEIIFDFAVAVAAIFMLRDKPTFTTLDQAYRSRLMSSLVNLLDYESDIAKIARHRKTNLSNIAKESVMAFRSKVVASSIWSTTMVETVSPQLVALKALDLLVIGLRNTGNVESIVDQDTATKLINIAASASERCSTTTETGLVLNNVFSILEAVSLAKQKPLVWSARMLQRLAGAMPTCFETEDTSIITLAVKLCMNLTNNKPKACQQFSDSTFVQSLVRSIIDRTELLHIGLDETQRAEALDTLILSLGAMINLTEHSDQARVNIDDGKRLIETLVKTFVDGSAKSAQAVSMEESQTSVAVGYLSVLLGNMCLNRSVKTKVRAHLPSQQLTALIDKIKEFVHVHEHVNRKAKQFEGEEGQATWQNYTSRIMMVVKQLEHAGT